MVDKWHSSVEWGDATWPSHGQPRGTQSPVEVACFKKKIVLGSMGFEPMTTTKPNTLKNGHLPMRHINVYVIKPIL
jgi:hypothetical protein